MKKTNKNNMTTHEEENENLHKADQVYFLYDPQPVRLLDVIYVGPVMIYAGIKGKNLNPFVKWSLIGVGICTILYNGANFFINEKKALERRRKLKEEVSTAAAEVANQEALLKKKMSDEMTEAVTEDNLPVQVAVEQPENESIDNMQLPSEVMKLLEVDNNDNQAIVKKGRGRPSKQAVDESKLIENNGNHETS
jgi:hypothetical protein